MKKRITFEVGTENDVVHVDTVEYDDEVTNWELLGIAYKLIKTIAHDADVSMNVVMAIIRGIADDM